jgi:hypothetical protein
MMKNIWTLTLLVGMLWTGHSSRPIPPGACDIYFQGEMDLAQQAIDNLEYARFRQGDLYTAEICENKSYCFQWKFLSSLLWKFCRYGFGCTTLFQQASERLGAVLRDAIYVPVRSADLKDHVRSTFEQTCLMGLNRPLPELGGLPRDLAKGIFEVHRAAKSFAYEGAALAAFAGTTLGVVVATSGYYQKMLSLENIADSCRRESPIYQNCTFMLASIGNFFGPTPDSDSDAIHLTRKLDVVCAVAQNELSFILSRIDSQPDDLEGIRFMGSSILFSSNPRSARLKKIIKPLAIEEDTVFFSYLGEKALRECRRIHGISDLVFPETEDEDLSESSITQLLHVISSFYYYLRTDQDRSKSITRIAILVYGGGADISNLTKVLSSTSDFLDFAAKMHVVLVMGSENFRDPLKIPYHILNDYTCFLQTNPSGLRRNATVVLSDGKVIDVDDGNIVEYSRTKTGETVRRPIEHMCRFTKM